MQVPIEITFQHCAPSEKYWSEIARQVMRLEEFSARITSCSDKIVISGPQN